MAKVSKVKNEASFFSQPIELTFSNGAAPVKIRGSIYADNARFTLDDKYVKVTKCKPRGVSVGDVYKQEIFTFKRKVESIMLKNGADQNFIDEVLTDAEVEFAINNDLTEEELAWGLMF